MKTFGVVFMLVGATAAGLVLGQAVAPKARAAAPTTSAIEATPAPSTAPTLPSVGAAPALSPGFREFKTTNWDDLTPKDWDPLKQFRNLDFARLEDSDPRAAALLQRMRATWDNAPTNNAMDGQTVRIAGYLVPLDETKAGLTQFLLVPYFGACIHTPPPPSNQIIEVRPTTPTKGLRAMDTVWVSGTLRTLRSDTYMGAASYRMQATLVEPYVPKEAPR
jgi:uncharacterized protein